MSGGCVKNKGVLYSWLHLIIDVIVSDFLISRNNSFRSICVGENSHECTFRARTANCFILPLYFRRTSYFNTTDLQVGQFSVFFLLYRCTDWILRFESTVESYCVTLLRNLKQQAHNNSIRRII